MEVYYLIVFFIFGTVLGSFYNVVGYRLPNNMSLIRPASHCTKCNHKLTPIELIPIISYVIQGGKCKNCKDKIAIFYPIFEFTTGILFALTYLIFGINIDMFIALVFLSMVLILILSDILYMVIPDSLLIFCGSIIFILKVIQGGFSIIPSLLIDMIIPFIVLYLFKLLGDKIFKRESLGWGDIKLMLVFGLTIGWKLSLLSIVLASFIALPISLVSLKLKGNKSHELPFGPYLGISALIFLFTRVDAVTILKFLGII